MSGERLMASYLVRVTVRDGRRSIGLHVVDRGENRRFTSYAELIAYFERHEDRVAGRSRPDDGPADPSGPDEDSAP